MHRIAPSSAAALRRAWVRDLLAGAAFLTLVLGCGKGPNLDPSALVEFPNILPEIPRTLTSNTAPGYTSGRALAVSGDEVFVADPTNGVVVVMGVQDLSVRRMIPVDAGPEQLVVDDQGTAWVSLRHGGAVARIEAHTSVVADEVVVGGEPYGLALSPEGYLYVGLMGTSEVLVVEADDLKVIQRVSAGGTPRGLAVSPDGHLTVVREHGPAAVFTLHDGRIEAHSEGEVALRRGNPTDILVRSGRVARLHATRALAATVHPETGDTLIAHVQAEPGDIDGRVDQLMQVGDHGDCDGGGCDSGGEVAYGSSSGETMGEVLLEFPIPDRPVEAVVTTVSGGSSGPLQATLPVQDPLAGLPMTQLIDQPSDIHHHPTHTLAFVTGQGSANVLVLNTRAGDLMRSPLAIIDVGTMPSAIVFSEDGLTALVLNEHDFSLSQVDLTPLLQMQPTAQRLAASESDRDNLMSHREMEGLFQEGFDIAALVELDADTDWTATEPMRLAHDREVVFGQDPASDAVRRGRMLFHDATNERMSHAGTFACATCHHEGREDKLVWFISDGPRQTSALAERLADTAPFNWSGSKDDLDTNMVQTVERMGGDGLTDQELADLEQFLLHGLVAPINPNRHPSGLTDAQELGRQIFEDPQVGCAGCHTGETLTDGLNHDVGTVSADEELLAELQGALDFGVTLGAAGLNTPSLEGLFYTAPYLHDGSAETLREVLERTGDRMGKISHLTESELDALVAYLLTL